MILEDKNRANPQEAPLTDTFYVSFLHWLLVFKVINVTTKIRVMFTKQSTEFRLICLYLARIPYVIADYLHISH